MGLRIPLIALVVVLIAAGLFLALGAQGSAQTVKIGWIGPQSGSSAVLGLDGAVAAQIAVDQLNARGGVNGQMLELLVEDDQYNTAKTLAAYEKLVHADGARILIVQTYGAMFALFERAKADEVILIDALDANDKLAGLGAHVFCVGVESESIARLLAGHAKEQGFEKVGVLYFNSDTFMPYVKDVFVEEFDGTVVAEGHGAGTADFRGTLLKMQSQDVEAIVFLGYDEVGTAMAQARTLGMELPFLAPGTVTSPSLQEAAGGAAEGTVFTFWKAQNKGQEPAKSFLAEFERRQGREPIVELFTYPSYDAIIALGAAMERGGTGFGDLQREMVRVKGIPGATGEITFKENGSMPIPFTLYKLENGAPVPIE